MEINDYQEQALTTIATIGIDETLKMTSVGLLGELIEVSERVTAVVQEAHEINGIIDEIGDVFWYLAVMSAHCGITFDAIAEDHSERLTKRHAVSISFELHNAFKSAKSITEALKKYLWHGHRFPFRKEIIVSMRVISNSLEIIAHHYDSSLNEVLEKNIAKLQRRYPNGFDAIKSMERGN